MKRTIRVGVVGLGKIAHIAELPALSEIPEAKIVAAYSRTEESLKRAAAKYEIGSLCSSFEEFLGIDMDCAFVLTPKTDHRDYVVSLLRKGLDVFCEKPLALTLRDSKEMVDAARAAGRILMAGFNRRYAPVYAKVKETYASGTPDVVIAEKSRNGSEYRATLENAIHMVDLMRWYCGEAVEVQARSKYSDPEKEDLATAQIKFDRGGVGILVACRTAGQWTERLEAYGGGISAIVDAPDSVSIVDRESEVRTSMTPRALGWARVEDKMGFTQEVRHFIDCVESRASPLTSGEDAYKTHLLMHEILSKAGLPGLDEGGSR